MKSIYVQSKTLPEGWENAVVRTWNEGASFRTEYDKPGDPESKDVTLMLHITEPFSEPRIHRGFPGGLDDLEKYVMEVIYGVHDHWVNPSEGKWEYTYHERLFNYKLDGKEIFGEKVKMLDRMMENSLDRGKKTELSKMFDHQSFVIQNTNRIIDQISSVIEKLKSTPHTRRAQAVTWQAWNDIGIADPSCLQRMWFRCEPHSCPICNGKGEIPHGLCTRCNGIGKIDKLNMNIHIRSNDAYKAGFMNMYAFTELQKWVAEQVGVEVGEYVHIADSFHIYGSYFNEFEGFLKMVRDRTWEGRIWTTSFAIPMFVDGCNVLLNEADMPEEKKKIILGRKKYLESL